jgi:hypothetical protein
MKKYTNEVDKLSRLRLIIKLVKEDKIDDDEALSLIINDKEFYTVVEKAIYTGGYSYSTTGSAATYKAYPSTTTDGLGHI